MACVEADAWFLSEGIMNRKLVTAVFVLYALLLAVSRSEAYEFRPTDQEWANWPGYCQARYIGTNVGRSSRFINRVSAHQRQELAQWDNAGMRGIHHFCAGMAWLYRAKLEDDSRDRKYKLTEARRETQFSLDRSNRAAPQFAIVAIQMATILHEQGETDNAIELLQSLIQAQPKNDLAYSAAATFYGKMDRFSEARQVLLRGNEATEGKSAEIQYNLGLVSLELGAIEDARRYADSAYDLGYPLPGLRARLERLERD